MSMTIDELESEIEVAKKGGGGDRAPRLGIGNYMLMVIGTKLVQDQFSRKKPKEKKAYQGAVAQFKVIEASPGSDNPPGTKADKYFRLNAQTEWARDNDLVDLRSFLEAVTGSKVPGLVRTMDANELIGFQVRCQVVPGKKEDFPDFFWTHVEQSPEDIERRAAEL